MKIKEISLYGFKSFYGETKFLLCPGITAFVGPNGSGKSNIFDALRWVFGEQSMKALRCEKNEDLIHISPDGEDLNFTEVSVTIENEDFFPQFGSEFEIRRKFYRNGESEFYLNRVKCRLQDIQALFLNSGTLTYSFLELSEIEKIISGETKEMFDDVSGVLKYQERREQTKRRLEQTEQDLLRLEDVIGEMERSVRLLKRQTRQAQVYQDLKEEYKIVSLYLLKAENNKSLEELNNLQIQIDELQTKRQSILLAIKKLEEERLVLKNQISQAEQLKKEKISEITILDNELKELTDELLSKENEFRNAGIEQERHSVSVKEKRVVIESLNNKIIDFKKNLNIVQTELIQQEEHLEKEKNELENYSNEFVKVSREIEIKERLIAEKLKDIQIYRNEISKFEINRLNKEAIILKAKSEKESFAETQQVLNNEKTKFENELQKVIEEQNRLSQELEEKQSQLKNIEKSLAEVEEKLNLRQSAINDCRLIIDTLKNRLGSPEGMKEINQKFGEKVSGLFRDYLEVLPGYELVVDICLGEILNYYILNEFNVSDFSQMPEGKFGFVTTKSTPPDTDLPPELINLKRIDEFVKIKSNKDFLKRYLINYFLVENFADALKLSEKFPNYGFVIADGLLFNNGKITIQKGEYGYFQITERLNQEKKRLESLQNEVVFFSDEKKRLFEEMQKNELLIEQYREQLFPLNIKKSELSMRIGELEKKITSLLSEANEIDLEIKKLDDEIRKINEEGESLRQKVNQEEEAIKQLEMEIQSLKKDANEIEDLINKKNVSLNDIIIKIGVLKERKSSLTKLIADTENEIKNLEDEIKKEEEIYTPEKLSELNQIIENLKSKIADKNLQRQKLQSELPDLMLEELNKKLELAYEELTQKQKLQEEIQNEIMQLNYALFEVKHKMEELQKKAKEEFQTDLNDYHPEEIAEPEVKLNEIKERMAKLGTINPLSFEAYQQEKKRLDEFLAQRNDIIAAKQSLLKSIEELDTRAKERFLLTFSEIKEKFNSVFANFFEGGEADLVLSDPANPLVSQVDIVVRMKGKRVKRINQLSGGERTLLAVSLLLAFYLVKPAPFCILDEIDAPLDDANVVRFNRFLRDLSQHTQVIIITHNRTTMEYADYIYGLTMEKPGQSKIVSARLADLEKID
ncbi:MAG: chromosome segregation protein SMC [candidate division WOR-3 bacterium]